MGLLTSLHLVVELKEDTNGCWKGRGKLGISPTLEFKKWNCRKLGNIQNINEIIMKEKLNKNNNNN
jgi:hypothetical protein